MANSLDLTISLEYRIGELVDSHDNGRRAWFFLNKVRKSQGLPAMTERDFPGENIPEVKAP